MPKRAALLLDRLLVALQKAVDNEELGKGGASRPYVRPLQDYPDISDSPRMHLSDEKTVMFELTLIRVYYFDPTSGFKRSSLYS